MKLSDEIKKFLKGEVYDDEATLQAYSHDASLFEVKPALVVAPKDAKDIEALVKFATKHEGVSLTPRSGGTDMSGGALTESVVVDMQKHLNHIKEVGGDFAVTEPGVYYRDFEAATLRKGLLLPSYPASREMCTIGGMVANNSGGEKTLAYGKTERYVSSLKAVLADGKTYELRPLDGSELKKKMASRTFEGRLYKGLYTLVTKNAELLKRAKPNVSKNSAGYYLWNVWDSEKKVFDITKLFVGSQGTLGIATEVKFRLVKPKPYAKMLVLFLRDTGVLGELAKTAVRFGPESFESFDDNTLKLVFRYLPDLIKLIKPKNMFSLMLKFLPEAWMILTGGFPKLVMLLEFTGDSEAEALKKMQTAAAALKKFPVKMRLVKTDEEARKYWVMRRESFNLLRYHLKNKRTAPFIDDVVVRPELLPQFLPQLNAMLAPYKSLTYTIAGHVGDGNIHVIPLMDMRDPASRQIIPELSKKVYDLVLKFGGSTTGEHNDGLIRTPYLEQMYGKEVYKLFQATKKLFDPKNIFNPGKKVDGDLDYAMEHLRTEQE
ncbi:MAG: FAD-binding oxidoreductase [bacterium]|nr:FAD-binding oxidoreductase [bacterium]